MSIQDKLKEANLSGDTKVTLVYSDGEDVVHAWDGYEQQVLENTEVAKYLAELVTDPSFKNNEVLDEMRSQFLLEDYPRDGSGFTEFVEEVIKDNLYDYEWIERSTEHYDYKRGFTTMEARLKTTVEEVLNASPYSVTGWDAEVETEIGHTTIKGG